MKAAALILALAGCLLPRPGAAQALDACTTCVKAADCDSRQASCVAECRARLFDIDPQRPVCISDCSSKSAQCSLAAATACRARNQCR